MSFDRSKYRFFNAGNKVIAVSTYAGKTVCGFAVCDPRDSFDEEKGRDLAAARCNAKVAAKRLKRAVKKRAEAAKILADAQKHYDRMVNYYHDSLVASHDANKEVNDLISRM